MYTCPKCGSSDVHRTDAVGSGCGTILMGLFMLFFLGILGGPPNLVAWLVIISVVVGAISIMAGLTGDRYSLRCNQCEHKWKTS